MYFKNLLNPKIYQMVVTFRLHKEFLIIRFNRIPQSKFNHENEFNIICEVKTKNRFDIKTIKKKMKK